MDNTGLQVPADPEAGDAPAAGGADRDGVAAAQGNHEE
jgi:hypothetical protein